MFFGRRSSSSSFVPKTSFSTARFSSFRCCRISPRIACLRLSYDAMTTKAKTLTILPAALRPFILCRGLNVICGGFTQRICFFFSISWDASSASKTYLFQ